MADLSPDKDGEVRCPVTGHICIGTHCGKEVCQMRFTAPNAEHRPCTCHPDDNPPVPCPRKYALTECREAARSHVALMPLSEENAASRKPLPVEVLAGALQDKIDTGPERTRTIPSTTRRIAEPDYDEFLAWYRLEKPEPGECLAAAWATWRYLYGRFKAALSSPSATPRIDDAGIALLRRALVFTVINHPDAIKLEREIVTYLRRADGGKQT